MKLRSIKLRHFRCFEQHEAQFAPGMNLIIGPNAHGKTSLMESVCILFRLQSPRSSRLGDAIQHGRKGLVVDGFADERRMQFYYSASKKKLALDGVEQSTAAEYLQIGRIAWFAMSDIDLVRGGSELRRRFLDFVAAQVLPQYRAGLRSYERALRSRNALLKAPAVRWREVDAFEEPLVAAGKALTAARMELVGELSPHAAAAHAGISGSTEELCLEYVPGAGADFAESLKASRAEDARLRQTCAGPHRDDLRLLVNERTANFASEGQQRTMVLALKIAAARLLEQHFSEPPLLLLDDIFGELDFERRAALLAALPPGAQKLITTTDLAWVNDAVDRSGAADAHILRLGPGRSDAP